MMTTPPALPKLPRVGDASGLEPDARFYPEELELAFRNHALLLEGLSYDRTPTGLHYTLTHYDVPRVDPATWRLNVSGHVSQVMSLGLEDLQRRPTRTLRMTLECAGEAVGDDSLLAWSMNDAPLEPQHGAPLRLVAPGWYGMADVKWVGSIAALTEPFGGYQHTRAYRYSQTREEAGEPVTLMRARSLMI